MSTDRLIQLKQVLSPLYQGKANYTLENGVKVPAIWIGNPPENLTVSEGVELILRDLDIEGTAGVGTKARITRVKQTAEITFIQHDRKKNLDLIRAVIPVVLMRLFYKVDFVYQPPNKLTLEQLSARVSYWEELSN